MSLPYRAIVVALLLCWFAYWGDAFLSAYSSGQGAEAARFSAEAGRDWRAADLARDEARRAAHGMASAVAMGILLPFGLLIALEASAVAARRTRKREER